MPVNMTYCQRWFVGPVPRLLVPTAQLFLQVHVFEFRMARGAAFFLACCLLAAGCAEAGRLGAKRSVLQATTINNNNNNNNNNGTCNDFHAGSNVFFAMFHVW
jgi:hypothetical protein